MWLSAGLALLLTTPCLLSAADNLVLNPNLDYSDHNRRQGLLFTGDHLAWSDNRARSASEITRTRGVSEQFPVFRAARALVGRRTARGRVPS